MSSPLMTVYYSFSYFVITSSKYLDNIKEALPVMGNESRLYSPESMLDCLFNESPNGCFPFVIT